jgi:hypothetical protein
MLCYEVLAGDASLETSVRENGATFKLDYGRVYWNSRLEREHRRLIESMGPQAVVCDMFAGIGPFAVPMAMRGCRVYANDLNPESVRWLRTNVQANKAGPRVAVSELDARAFVRGLLSRGTPAAGAPEAEGPAGALPFGPFQHVLMNLPATAVGGAARPRDTSHAPRAARPVRAPPPPVTSPLAQELFLDAFVGAFDRATWTAPLPRRAARAAEPAPAARSRRLAPHRAAAVPAAASTATASPKRPSRRRTSSAGRRRCSAAGCPTRAPTWCATSRRAS